MSQYFSTALFAADPCLYLVIRNWLPPSRHMPNGRNYEVFYWFFLWCQILFIFFTRGMCLSLYVQSKASSCRSATHTRYAARVLFRLAASSQFLAPGEPQLATLPLLLHMPPQLLCSCFSCINCVLFAFASSVVMVDASVPQTPLM